MSEAYERNKKPELTILWIVDTLTQIESVCLTEVYMANYEGAKKTYRIEGVGGIDLC